MTSLEFANAFLKNCPGVRMMPDEAHELRRLFWECWKEAARQGQEKAQNELSRHLERRPC